MSGHSKFSTIKHKKEKNDLAKAKIFTKLGKEITVAVKTGGADRTTNKRLYDAIYKAKSNNMPNDNIDRLIKKASGENDGANFESITYEGYGPNGTSIIVTTLTDNRNRTVANVRNAFTKGNGNLGNAGSVAFMFDEKGSICVLVDDADEEELMELALSNGATNFEVFDEYYEISTSIYDFTNVLVALENANVPVFQSQAGFFPQTTVELTDELDIKKMNKLLSLLEEDDDVQDIFHNWVNE